MSTQQNHYIILGVLLPYPKGDSEAYDKYEKFLDSAYKPKKKGFVVLFDGMNGDYVIAGHSLGATECDTMEGFGDAPVTLELRDLEGQCEDVRADLREKLGITDLEPKVIVVTHTR